MHYDGKLGSFLPYTSRMLSRGKNYAKEVFVNKPIQLGRSAAAVVKHPNFEIYTGLGIAFVPIAGAFWLSFLQQSPFLYFGDMKASLATELGSQVAGYATLFHGSARLHKRDSKKIEKK